MPFEMAKEAAMGKSIQRKREANPYVAELYDEYLLCRTTVFHTLRKPTGKKDGSEKLVMVIWPSGFSILPNPGGLNDQSYIVAKLFAAFRRGEEQGQLRSVMSAK